MTCVRVGVWCADNVYSTCSRRGQDEGLRARAWSQEYLSGEAQRDIWGAHWDSEASDGVLCSSAVGNGLKLTCKMRAAWAGLSEVRQEGFQASYYDSDAS